MSTVKSIKFNAGKVQYDDNTHRCTPLAHKGVISIKANPEEPELFDFVWSPKGDVTVAGNVPEKENLLLMPGDVSFKHIKSCQTGRVFALTFFSSGAKYLYWLQDVGDIDQVDQLTQKDINLAKSVNDLISMKYDEEEDDEEEEEQEPDQESKETGEQSSAAADEEPKSEDSIPHFDTVPVGSSRLKNYKTPIGKISDFITLDIIEKHLAGLSQDQIKELYGEYIPSTGGDLMNVIRSAFYQQCTQRLSHSLINDDGAGWLFAQSLKYDFEGEGINYFLKGIRKLGEQEKEEERLGYAATKKREEEDDDDIEDDI
ncbi:proteasome complex subunit Rpn13 ubiquitin receptor-domain-containing protein [Scheffersomyces coipomensis]|uniref:proteasome complex subunit Rpn13 ubiquitin receptor-domain-containing protein n=1 Tax=Scheffersomyces coipomensis TaxID=1788519 RepID=UPI00315CA7B1